MKKKKKKKKKKKIPLVAWKAFIRSKYRESYTVNAEITKYSFTETQKDD